MMMEAIEEGSSRNIFLKVNLLFILTMMMMITISMENTYVRTAHFFFPSYTYFCNNCTISILKFIL